MILFMWAIIFAVAVIPGGLIGWLVGKTPLPTLLCMAVLVGGSMAVGFAASLRIFNQSDMTAKYHSENLIMFAPPIILAMMLGLWISRAKKRPPVRPWYLPPENDK
ncbi:hypothetical protein [Bradyrhizobium sp.]|uniref:hypothetical protein n=1 Tax=Bradyrhizobium sp. TaxID=376 RepID=UPI004037978E